MEIKILGTGCEKEILLRQNLEAAMLDLAFDCPIKEVREVNRILEYRVSCVPALYINNRLVTEGKIVETTILKQYLKGNILRMT